MEKGVKKGEIWARGGAKPKLKMRAARSVAFPDPAWPLP